MDFGKSTTLRALTSEELEHVSGGDDTIVVSGIKKKSSDGGSGSGGFGGSRGGSTGGGRTGGGGGGGGRSIIDVIFPPKDTDGDGVPDDKDPANARGFSNEAVEASVPLNDGSSMVNFGDDEWYYFDKEGNFLGNGYKMTTVNDNTGGSTGISAGREGGSISVSNNGVTRTWTK